MADGDVVVAADDGAPLHSRVDGSRGGRPLLLISSLGTDLSMWEPQVPALGEHRVIRYDHRGHGRSAATPAPYTLERLGRDALAVLDAHAVDRAAVCGISLGGLVALWLGVHAPGRVDRLLLADTAARVGTEQGWRDRITAVRGEGMAAIAPLVMERFFSAAFRARDPDTVARITEALVEQPAEGYVGACAALATGDLRSDLSVVAAPTLIVVGSADEATPPEDADELHAGIAGSRLEVLPGAGHLSNLEQPRRFTELLLQLLDDVEG